jgi:tyrosyl-tRNA synthetase
MANLFEELKWRGLVYDATDGLSDLLARDRVTLYAGFDPTAASLHVGHLLPALTLARAARFDHHPIAVIGGGTGMIGDPSGKSQERTLLDAATIAENVAGVREQLVHLLGERVTVVDNADWLGPTALLSFLRDTGKCFTVNYMLQKESISRRLENEEGLSFTEFSYLLLQAYDFLQLFERHRCTVQIGGSDQWGNITAGIDLIRRVRAEKAHGLVMPLLTTSSGVKFGKTEAGAVWLDPERTSPFRFYQFWLNTDDRDVVTYAKFMTFLDARHIEALERAVRSTPEHRESQRTLAREMTTLVHGASAAHRAEHASTVLFNDDITTLTVEELLQIFDDVPSTLLSRSEFVGEGMGIVDLVARLQLAPSKGEARRLVQSGGVYVNNRRIADVQARITFDQAIGGRLLVVRKGQRQTHLMRIG